MSRWAELAGATDKADEASDAQLEELAKLILRGTSPDELANRMTAQAKVNATRPFLDFVDADYGSGDQRRSLTKSLWAAAERASAGGKLESGKTLARSALAVATVDRAGYGMGFLVQYLHRPEAARMLGISDRKRRELADSALQDSQATGEFVDAIGAAAAVLDELIKGDSKVVSGDDARAFLAFLDQAYAGVSDQPSDRWRLANMLWRFCCVSRLKNSPDALTEADRFVAARKLDPRSGKSDVAWLEQALTTPGPMPRSAGVGVISQPNDLKPRPE